MRIARLAACGAALALLAPARAGICRITAFQADGRLTFTNNWAGLATIESRPSLVAGSWSSLTNVTMTGVVHTVQVAMTNQTLFYRVIVQQLAGDVCVITAFDAAGNLTFSNSWRGLATVEARPSLVSGVWTSFWPSLVNVPMTDVVHTLQVPMTNRALFYRVVVCTNTASAAAPTGMVRLAGGTYAMGYGGAESASDEQTVHTVTLAPFHMDTAEVSYGLWMQVYNWATNHGYCFDAPGAGKADDHPVVQVNWFDCVKWCNARSQKEGRAPAYYLDAARTLVYTNGDATGLSNACVRWDSGYRLPTEAEWEYAARAGTTNRLFPCGNTISHDQAGYYHSWYYTYDLASGHDGPPDYSYYHYDGGSYHVDYGPPLAEPWTAPADAFAANALGLHNMAGNVAEWCWDWYGSYSSGPQDNPRGPDTGSYRVVRGGSAYDYAGACRLSARGGYLQPARSLNIDNAPGTGFRTVLPAP